MKTIDCSGYSGEWVARALAAMKKDGSVMLDYDRNTFHLFWGEKLDNEKRLVQAAAKLKGGAK